MQFRTDISIAVLASVCWVAMAARGFGQDSLDVLYGEVPIKTFVGARTTLADDQLNSTPATGYLPALTGRIPGFYTEQFSGFRQTNTAVNYAVDAFLGHRPLAGMNPPSENAEYGIALRGQGPLVVIDGIQRDIYSIDPENIETVTVLKDALSTIALGQRSSRGLLLITTKKPTAGRTRFGFTAQAGLQEPLGKPTVLPAYRFAYLLNEALTNVGFQPAYQESEFALFQSGSDPYRYTDTDWYDAVLRRSAPLMRYNLSANGGGKTAQFAIALNYTDQQGLFNESPTVAYNTNASLKRYLLNTNVNINITERLRMGLQVTGRIQDGNEPGVGMNTLLDALKKVPNGAYPATNANGTWASTNYFRENILAMTTHSGYRQDKMKDVMANVDLRYDLGNYVNGLSVKAITNIAVQSLNGVVRERKEPTYLMTVGAAQDTAYAPIVGAMAQSNNFNTVFNARYWFGQFGVDYDRDWGGHRLVVNLLADQRRTLFNFDLPAVATNATGKAAYDFAGKYMVQAALNGSGYNRYRPGYQYGLFYAVGLGWNIAEEAFIREKAPWVDVLKLRATYGKTGNGVDNSGYYDYRATFRDGDGRIGSLAYRAGTSRAELRGYWENPSLPNLRTWEGAHKLNVGLDGQFFGDGLHVVADVYYDRYFDLLQTRGKSIEIIGIAYPSENIGRNTRKGVELELTHRRNRGIVGYFVSGNVTIERSSIDYFDEQDQRYPWMQVTGLPLGVRQGYIADGIFQTMDEVESGASTAGHDAQPGDIRYRDLNNDGIINQFDRAPITTQKPRLYYGVTWGVAYKGISASAMLQGVANRDIYLGDGTVHAGFQGFGGHEQAYAPVADRWTPETAGSATYPRLTIGETHNYAESSFWVRSGDFFRLKNVQLAYDFPQGLNQRLRLQGLRVFANALNVATWSAYNGTGQDPEVGIGAYPLQRVVNLGLNINF